MANLSLKDLDEALMREVKVRATSEGLGMREGVIKALRMYTTGKTEELPQNPQKIQKALAEWEKPSIRAGVIEPEIAQKIKRVADVKVDEKPEREKKKGACPRCEGDLIPWGPDWHCFGCGRNFGREIA